MTPETIICPSSALSSALSVCLSCYNSLYLGNYELDFVRYVARALREARNRS